MAKASKKELAEELVELGKLGAAADLLAVRRMMAILPPLFTALLLDEGFDAKPVTAMTRKFRDAGRRSPPWKPTSSRVPGRPQDGADGNRRLRWLFPSDHKFYADERTATLVEVRYYLQAFSMDGAPTVPAKDLANAYFWLTGHPVSAGNYRDPIQLTRIALPWVLEEPRRIQSGHLVPLDRGGRHAPDNAFLMLARSNQLQGNQTLDELLTLMENILQRHNLGGPQEPTVEI
jgi:hypothetical protein